MTSKAMTSIFAKAVTLVPLVVVASDILSPNARSIDIEDSAFVETYEQSTQNPTRTKGETGTPAVAIGGGGGDGSREVS